MVDFSVIALSISLIFSFSVLFFIIKFYKESTYRLHYSWLTIGYLLQIIYTVLIIIETLRLKEDLYTAYSSRALISLNYLITSSYTFKFLFFTELKDLFCITTKRIILFLSHFLLAIYGYFCSYVLIIGALADCSNTTYIIAHNFIESTHWTVPLVMSVLSIVSNLKRNAENLNILILNSVSMVASTFFIDSLFFKFGQKGFIIIAISILVKCIFDVKIVDFMRSNKT